MKNKWTQFKKMEINPILVDDVDEIWKNNQYEVQLKFIDLDKGKKGFVWLQLKHVTKEAIHDWRDMQRIKNELLGPEREAVELYPAESRLVDTSNQFHLFILPEGEKTDFGYTQRGVVSGHDDFIPGKGGSKQRAFDKDPKDAITLDEAKAVASKLYDTKF